MKVYLYCIDKTISGIVLAKNKDEGKVKLLNEYPNANSYVICDPTDMDIVGVRSNEVIELDEYFRCESAELVNLRKKMSRVKKVLGKLIKDIT